MSYVQIGHRGSRSAFQRIFNMIQSPVPQSFSVSTIRYMSFYFSCIRFKIFHKKSAQLVLDASLWYQNRF